MKQYQYLIGDVAELAGVSRDTLRFYEKKGILSPKKEANGYRYFTEEDVQQLSSILYHRKMNLGLDEIEELWHEDHSFRFYETLTKEKIRQEEAAIEEHRKSLARLKAVLSDNRRVDRQLNRIHLEHFPAGRIVKICNSVAESVMQYFQLSREHAGMDLIYTYDFYNYQSGFSIGESSLTFTRSQLLFYEHLISRMKPDFDFSLCPQTEPVPCIHTILELSTRFPDMTSVERMRQWALSHGLCPKPEIISGYLMHGMKDGQSLNYLDVYIPVMNAAGIVPDTL